MARAHHLRRMLKLPEDQKAVPRSTPCPAKARLQHWRNTAITTPLFAMETLYSHPCTPGAAISELKSSAYRRLPNALSGCVVPSIGCVTNVAT